jgi:hypothetical protein
MLISSELQPGMKVKVTLKDQALAFEALNK